MNTGLSKKLQIACPPQFLGFLAQLAQLPRTYRRLLHRKIKYIPVLLLLVFLAHHRPQLYAILSKSPFLKRILDLFKPKETASNGLIQNSKIPTGSAKSLAKAFHLQNIRHEHTDNVLKSSLSQLSLLMSQSKHSSSGLDVNPLGREWSFERRAKRLTIGGENNGDAPFTVQNDSTDDSSEEKENTGVPISEVAVLDLSVFKQCRLLWKLAVPSYRSREMMTVLLLIGALAARTFMSIWIASIHGSVVKGIVDRDIKVFLKSMGVLVFYSTPASFINSAIQFLGKRLSLYFRQRLTYSFLKRYLANDEFYRISALDSRIEFPDQRLTEDIVKWADCLSSVFSTVTKPILDIILLSNRLATHVGAGGPMAIILWYCLSAILQKQITPAFGKLATTGQLLEGSYRSAHASIVTHSEEIAFYRGSNFEMERLTEIFARVVQHTKKQLLSHLFVGCFDDLLVKYGAVIVGYSILAFPVFGMEKKEYASVDSAASSQITLDYVRNSSLMINLGKAIGKIVTSRKEMQVLIGMTRLICEMNDVLDDLQGGYALAKDRQGIGHKISIQNHGLIKEAKSVKLSNVPICTPSGDLLLSSVSFEVPVGAHLFITGPNGCGKSSIFRVIGGLWPLSGGELHKPKIESLFYIPQRPYLPIGTLREQIIYPESNEVFVSKGKNDDELRALLEATGLSYLEHRSNSGLDIRKNWAEELSGGEKQRLGVARLSYHRPVFAILDEATSAVSVDVESGLYTYMKKLGISLITVSHRMHLLKHHDYILRVRSQDKCTFEKIDQSKSVKYQSFSNLLTLEENI